jgi:serine protease
MRRSPRLFALLAAFSLLAAGSSSASAHTSVVLSAGTEVLPIFRGHVQPANTHKPVRNNNLSSHGGAIQRVPKVYISWWGPEWSTGFSTGGYTSGQAQTYNADFFTNVGGSSWNNVVKQYCQNVPSGTQDCSSVSGAVYITNPGGQFGGAWNDTTAVPSSPTQSSIFAAAQRLMGHFGYDANATYMVYTPHGKSMSGFGTQWCAWHSSGSTSSGQLAYAYIPYLPDAGTSCGRNFVNATNNTYGNGYFDGFSVVAGHEYSEAETDPFPSSGWVDRNGAENADKCAWSASSGNISLGGKQYAVQPTWSNATSGCAMSAS